MVHRTVARISPVYAVPSQRFRLGSLGEVAYRGVHTQLDFWLARGFMLAVGYLWVSFGFLGFIRFFSGLLVIGFQIIFLLNARDNRALLGGSWFIRFCGGIRGLSLLLPLLRDKSCLPCS